VRLGQAVPDGKGRVRHGVFWYGSQGKDWFDQDRLSEV
jgi:hypothetical protein